MHCISTRSGPPPNAGCEKLCGTVFDSLRRSDQRRWAAAYVDGLIGVAGRKSIRRIAERLPEPGSTQCLQQFVNQSPWDWAPVRRTLTEGASTALPVLAWVVREVEFPKVGVHSAGVARQYAPGSRRALTCQLAMATWLAGDRGAVPTNWRLMLPHEWDGDTQRRVRAHIPPSERHRPAWEHIIDSIDEMTGSWKLDPRPVIADRRHDRPLEPLISALEERGLCYAVRITGRTPVTAAPRGRLPLLAGDLLRNTRREVVVLPAPDGSEREAGWASITHAQVPITPRGPGAGPAAVRPRRVLARCARPGDMWLTNLPASAPGRTLGLLDASERTDRDLAELRYAAGVDHFEGRSFRGWHHHVTLASVAHAHRLLHGDDRPELRGAFPARGRPATDRPATA